MPLVVNLPLDDSRSNELLDDQIEEAKDIQPNENMLSLHFQFQIALRMTRKICKFNSRLHFRF